MPTSFYLVRSMLGCVWFAGIQWNLRQLESKFYLLRCLVHRQNLMELESQFQSLCALLTMELELEFGMNSFDFL
ncbi:hypothetical protein HanRHA438_Chr05g0210301 [Helianthus annuus]|nr:hypothetical protein HanHA300_Chr05g0164621 [Helianthus annuus]KAJ0583614.1 hypothetical protein HanHA89_Chr05g0178681 [Helianthus annuus]KAJ0917807.1 hypothetical protein HanRHA438_Chr05g0210301 [Helianthus annuus]